MTNRRTEKDWMLEMVQTWATVSNTAKVDALQKEVRQARAESYRAAMASSAAQQQSLRMQEQALLMQSTAQARGLLADGELHGMLNGLAEAWIEPLGRSGFPWPKDSREKLRGEVEQGLRRLGPITADLRAVADALDGLQFAQPPEELARSVHSHAQYSSALEMHGALLFRVIEFDDLWERFGADNALTDAIEGMRLFLREATPSEAVRSRARVAADRLSKIAMELPASLPEVDYPAVVERLSARKRVISFAERSGGIDEWSTALRDASALLETFEKERWPLVEAWFEDFAQSDVGRRRSFKTLDMPEMVHWLLWAQGSAQTLLARLEGCEQCGELPAAVLERLRVMLQTTERGLTECSGTQILLEVLPLREVQKTVAEVTEGARRKGEINRLPKGLASSRKALHAGSARLGVVIAEMNLLPQLMSPRMKWLMSEWIREKSEIDRTLEESEAVVVRRYSKTVLCFSSVAAFLGLLVTITAGQPAAPGEGAIVTLTTICSAIAMARIALSRRRRDGQKYRPVRVTRLSIAGALLAVASVAVWAFA